MRKEKIMVKRKMEVVQNVWQVGGSDLTAAEDAAIYLIRFGRQAALIDSGCGHAHKQLVANISSVLPESIPIPYLFLTHCHYDHVGGAAALRDQYGCKIVAHQLDAAWLEAGDSKVTAAAWYGRNMVPLSIDHKVKGDTQRFTIGSGEIFAYHCPGHSPGSVVYFINLDNHKILFGQDVHGPLDSSFLSNREDYIRCLKFMIGLNADILCEGHFGIFKGKERIEKFIRSYMIS